MFIDFTQTPLLFRVLKCAFRDSDNTSEIPSSILFPSSFFHPSILPLFHPSLAKSSILPSPSSFFHPSILPLFHPSLLPSSTLPFFPSSILPFFPSSILPFFPSSPLPPFHSSTLPPIPLTNCPKFRIISSQTFCGQPRINRAAE